LKKQTRLLMNEKGNNGDSKTVAEGKEKRPPDIGIYVGD